MLQHISRGIAVNHPDVHLIVLLIDERPEEVTDMRRNVTNGEVIASSLDEDVYSHVRLSQLSSTVASDWQKAAKMYLADGLDHAIGPSLQQVGRQ